MQILEKREKQWVTLTFLIIVLGIVAKWKSTIPDNDNFWQIAVGRYIVENRVIPMINPFVIHKNFNIIIQQWLFDVLIYKLYNLGGAIALTIYAIIIEVLFFLSMYRFVKYFAKDKKLRIVASLISGFIVLNTSPIRPSILTLIILLNFIPFLEKYRKTPTPHIIIYMAITSIILANIQLALWISFIILTMPYICCDFFTKKREINVKQWFHKKQYLIYGIIISLFAGLINPYKIDGLLYLINSYTFASKENLIYEMQVPILTSFQGEFIILTIILSIIYFYKTGINDLCQFFMTFGTIIIAFTHYRNFWFITFAFIPIFCVLYEQIKPNGIGKLYPTTKTIKLLIITLGSLTLIVILCTFYGVPYYDIKDTNGCNIAAADYLDEYDGDIILYTEFNNGGYMEFRGYKVYIDARPELYSKSINKQENIYEEFINVYSYGNIKNIENLINKYNFTHILTQNNSYMSLYMQMSNKWKCVIENETYYLFEWVGDEYG